MNWTQVASESDFVTDAGGCIKIADTQIAIFNYGKGEWYAVQNSCPHMNQMVLSRGLIGDKDGEPKVACPLHKHNFSLKSGKHLGGEEHMCLKTYPVKVEDGAVYLDLDSIELTENTAGSASCGS